MSDTACEETYKLNINEMLLLGSLFLFLNVRVKKLGGG